MRPAVGSSNPATSRRVVVLPQPDGPSSEKNSPAATDRSMLSTAAACPARACPNRLVSPTRSMAAAAMASSPYLRAHLLSLPLRWLPGEPELAGREAHGEIISAGGRHIGVFQGDLYGHTVEQRRQRDRELARVDGGVEL